MLEQDGFKLNKYDPCVANKTIDADQCTVLWYINDSKISHQDPEISNLKESFGELTVIRGHKYTFVGMNIEMQNNGKVSISMINYFLQEYINAFGGSFNGGVKTPARSSLFEIDTESKELPENKQEICYHIVAKLLFVAKGARPDIDLEWTESQNKTGINYEGYYIT